MGGVSRVDLNGQCNGASQELSKVKCGGLVSSSLICVTVSSSTLRTLDAHGVDHSLKKNMLVSCGADPVVFSHRMADGKYKLESGLFISDPANRDRVDEFRFYSGLGAIKSMALIRRWTRLNYFFIFQWLKKQQHYTSTFG